MPTAHTTRLVLMLGLLLGGCGRDEDPHDHPHDHDTDEPADTDTDTDDELDLADPYSFYEFESRFEPGVSSVAYDGQIFRHLLIHDLNRHVQGLTARIDSGWFPEEGEVAAELDFYFSFDGDTSGDLPHQYAPSPAPLQQTYAEVSSGKDLVGKIAGNAAGGYLDWSTEFAGWPAEGVSDPESLVRLWFDQLDALARDRANGNPGIQPDGTPIPTVYLTEDGLDLHQLLGKFLGVSIAFWQAADYYLDDDTPEKGLLGANGVANEGKPFTALEHHWDEAFGYFGASRRYGTWDQDLIAGAAHADDVVEDGKVDLLTEVSWGHSTNAAKRDRGAVNPTTLVADAWDGFVGGRLLIHEAGGDLDEAQLTELKGYRDQAVGAWEQAIAATVVHYINDTLQDMNAFGTEDYSFADHAKHWAEMKGFALGLQFNPRSPLSRADFLEVHALFGVAPALPTWDEPSIEAYRDALLDARAILGAAYSFDEANLGDDDGENGW